MRKISTVVVTGGAGFIGSGVVRQLMNETDITLINIDALTYAGRLWKREASPFPTLSHSWEMGWGEEKH